MLWIDDGAMGCRQRRHVHEDEQSKTSRAALKPSIWLMVGDRPGDTAQALAVARAIGLPFVVKQVIPFGGTRVHKAPRGPFTPEQLDSGRSDGLMSPWPNLAVCVGRWPTAAALWVRKRSSGRTHVVLVGRPRPGELNQLALVLVPCQYQLPAHPAVIRLGLPPQRVDREAVARAALCWQHRLAALPRPLTAVLVGGPTKPFRLDATVAQQLADDINGLLEREGGSAYVATGPRTKATVPRALAGRLAPPSCLFDWRTDASADNPYFALLACADRFVVTGDSVSMLVEVASFGRPLAIYPLPKPYHPGLRLQATVRRWLFSGGADRAGLIGRLGLLAHRLGLLGFPRDLEAVHRVLYARGLAVRFGQPFPAPGPGLDDTLADVGARLRGLLPDPRRAEPVPSPSGLGALL